MNKTIIKKEDVQVVALSLSRSEVLEAQTACLNLTIEDFRNCAQTKSISKLRQVLLLVFGGEFLVCGGEFRTCWLSHLPASICT